MGRLFSFRANFKEVHGITMHSAEEAGRHLRHGGHARGYCDPALVERLAPRLGEGITLSTRYDRLRYDDYQFGITRATAAIANREASCCVTPKRPAGSEP